MSKPSPSASCTASPIRTHERRVGEAVARRLPNLTVTLSSEVAPEMREYERFSTACANAYLQPLMGSYMKRLESELARAGFRCPMLLMTSGGGITTTDTAIRFPVRLVESGPAGGAIFAAAIARQNGLDQGRLLRHGRHHGEDLLYRQGARRRPRAMFEVARHLSLRQGQRSAAPHTRDRDGRDRRRRRLDRHASMRSAASRSVRGAPARNRGRSATGRGGSEPTVTDADVALGRIDPATFSGGKMVLDGDGARQAIADRIGAKLDLSGEHAALGISEMVDENMANAARVHAIESGKDLRPRTLIAFGGAAPLHAARVAEKLGIGRVLIPTNAGVGSAVGLLRAPVAYEIVRGHLMRLSSFDAAAANRLLAAMRAEAEAIVRRGAAGRAARRAAFGLYALSRPGPRDRGRASGARLRRRRPCRHHDAVRGRLSPALQPADSRRRDRDTELGGIARRAGRRGACRRSPHPSLSREREGWGRTETARPAAGVRSTKRRIRRRADLLARGFKDRAPTLPVLP